MSQLRAPEARPERRRRTARPSRGLVPTRPPPGRAPHSCPPMPAYGLRSSARPCSPAIAVALSGAAAVIITVRSTSAPMTTQLWAALGGSAALAVAAVVAAFLGANRVATTVLGRCLALRRASAQGQTELQRVVEQLRNGEPIPARRPPQPVPPGSDAFDLLAQEMGRSHEGAVAAVVQAARLTHESGEEQRVEVFVNLAHAAPVARTP